jgi:hypothetical protein
METKWIVICILGCCVAMFVPLAITEYSNGQCRIEAIKAGVEADKIKMACGIR